MATELQLVVCLTAVKLLLVPSYRSTDFEVHRNWLAITHSLPLSQWYTENTSEWTLDYPPLFAWFEWLLSQAAFFVDSRMLDISALGYDSSSTILFQRFTVILSDVILLSAACAISRPLTGHSRRSGLATFSLITANAGLLMVDHIHFQYNGMLIGVLLWAVHAAQRGYFTLACLLFATLINAKHLFAYAGPVFLVYLMRSYCCNLHSSSSITQPSQTSTTSPEICSASLAVKAQRSGLTGSGEAEPVHGNHSNTASRGSTSSSDDKSRPAGGSFKWSMAVGRFVWLGAVGASVTALSLGPFLLMGQGQQLLRRLFPFGRGLVHSYWAANVWALYCGLDKVVAVLLPRFGIAVEKVSGNLAGGLVGIARFSVLPQVEPGTTMLLVMLALVPCLAFLWRHPHPRHLPTAVAYAYLSGFVFGFHVHEKAALMALLPLAVSATSSRAAASEFLVLSSAAHYALFPLLYRPEEYHIKLLMALLYFLACYTGLTWALQDQQSRKVPDMAKQQPLLGQQQQKHTPKDEGQGFETGLHAETGSGETNVGQGKEVGSSVVVSFQLLSWLQIAYLSGFLALELSVTCLHPVLLGDRLPFLPLMATSLYCSIGVMWVWISMAWRYLREMGSRFVLEHASIKKRN